MFGGFSSNNPMASFAPAATPPAPRTPSEWKASLLEVKRLYLGRQYKQSAALSIEILKRSTGPIHPVYKTYLHFYAAISYEFLGRAAHLYSRTKITLLYSALDHFIDCSASLPATIALPKLPLTHVSPVPSPCASPTRTSYVTEPSTPEEQLLWFDARDCKSPGEDGLVHTITNMSDFTLSSSVEDPFISDSATQSQTPFFHSLSSLSTDTARPVTKKHPLVLSPIKPLATTTDPTKRDPLMPSPLKIRKRSDDHTGDGIPLIENTDSRNKGSARPRPPPLPLGIVPDSQLNIRNHKSRTATSSSKATVATAPRAIVPPRSASNENDGTQTAEGIDPARAAQIVRFNRGINFLREQIKSNITEIQQHVDHVEEIQRTRRSRKMQRAVSFWSFSPIKNEEVEEQQTQEPVTDQFDNIPIKETKQQRIARLRTEGWNTVGLRSPRSTWKGARYYQEFCNLVLTELYLDS